MTFRVSTLAERDLADIGDYIARDNPARARTFIDEIEVRFAEIAAQPTLYRLRNDVMQGLRAAAHGRYLVYFRCEANGEILFLRVLHGARDQVSTLSGQ